MPTTLVNPYITTTTGGGGGSGDTFHLTTTGNDSNPGSEAQPWLTFDHAVAQLGAGDTLIVGGGTYYDTTGVEITADGTAEAPITIVAKEGETPILDGSLAAYRTEGNSAWEVFDAGRHIYRTVATLPSPGDYGYTGRIDVDGTLYALTAYKDNDEFIATGLDALSADTDLYDIDAPYYMGPGATYHTDGRVYIRLDPNSDAAQWVGDPVGEAPLVIADLDPRNHSIYLAPNSTGININGNYVTVDGIDVLHHWVNFGGGGTNATVQNLTMFPGRFGARVDGDNWTFDNVTINLHRPPWLARSDVKGWGEPAGDNRSAGIFWEFSQGGSVLNSSIIRAFDGMLATGDNSGISVLNCVIDFSMDDALQLGSSAADIEFAYNTVTGAGPSHDEAGNDAADTPDTVYFHHNVFDNTTPVFWARKPVEGVDPSENGEGGYVRAPPIGSHGIPDFDDPWKLYNNTFVTGYSPAGQGANHYMYHGAAPGEGIHEVWNTLFNFVTEDTRVYRGTKSSTGLEIYDYNIYARQTPLGDFAIDTVDDGGAPVAATTSFAQWLTDNAASVGYAPGWDSHSIHQTTQVPLDGSYRPAIGGPADGNGVDLSATGWPGTSPGTDYIGAKAPV